MERYTLARVTGPRNREDSYSSYFSVVAFPAREQGGKFGNLAEIVKNYKDALLPGSEIESEGLTIVGGQGAVELAVSSTLKPSFHKGLSSKEIPIKTRTVFTQKGTMLYRITYSADARVFPMHAKKFDRLLETLRFLQ